MNRRVREALRRRLGMPPEDRVKIVGHLPALPNDRPAAVYTHATDAAAQAAIEANDVCFPNPTEND